MRPRNGNVAVWSVGLSGTAVLAGLTAVSGVSTEAAAAGFAVTAQSAAGIGRSSALTAQADDPSAVYFNPAGIVQSDRAAILLGAAVLRPHTEYEPSAGGNAATERERYYVLPHLYVTMPLGRRVSAGLGVFTPFGLSTKWPADWEGRFQVIDATVKATTINPVVAWRATDWFAVAMGAQFFRMKLTEKRALNLAAELNAPVSAEGAVSLSGDAYAFGYTGAVLVAPSPRWQVGVSFRSRANADVNDGSADFAVPAPYTSFFPDGEIQTALTLPPSLRTGLMIRPRPDWTVEVDATWTGWSTVDELAINFANGLPRNVTALGWNDSMTYSVGVEHRISSAVRLRGGYLYDPSPIPNAYATPLIPDADRQGLSVGVGFGAVQWSLDVGYQYLWFERVKNNSVGSNASSTTPPIDARANGEYSSTAHVVGVSVGYTF